MQYIKFPGSDLMLSKLGFGLMRLPNKDGHIDFAEAHKMTDHAIENGVNYLDTAYFYHHRESELFLKEVLERHGRSNLYIADKLPVGDCKEESDVERIVNHQCEKLGTDHIDFYMFHGLGKGSWQRVQELDAYKKLWDMQKQGRFKHVGFSFHDSPEVLDEILSYGKWDFVMIPFNYYDFKGGRQEQQYEVIKKHNVPMLVMEGVRGGSLSNLPRGLNSMFTDFAPDMSVSSWALRFAASFENVYVTLSGMSTMEQVKDNLKTFSQFKSMTKEENDLIFEMLKEMHNVEQIACTSCNYCDKCPENIEISRCFRSYNEFKVTENQGSLNNNFKDMKNKDRHPDKCTNCRVCVEICPQHLDIPTEFKKVLELVTEN